MFSAVFFDLDGTLVDTAADFERVLNRMLLEANLSPQPITAIRNQVSNGARALVTLGFGLRPEDAGFDQRLTQLLDGYATQVTAQAQLFPGMDKVLATLEASQVPWGIVTNKPERFTRPLLAGLSLDRRVGPVICPEQVRERKPHPEGLLLACREVGVEAADCLYVGDHERDIAAGIAAGMQTAVALYGYIMPDEDPRHWQATHLLSAPTDILPLIRKRRPA